MKYLICGISVRGMTESAVRSGYSVVALDAFGDQDVRSLAETYSLNHDFHQKYSPAALLDCSRSLSFDGIVYTSNLENYPDILDEFSAQREIIGNSPASVRAVRSWHDLFAGLKQAGFLVPETVFAGAEPIRRGAHCWLRKPMASGGGRGIAFIDPALNLERSCMLQQYIPGKPCSAAFAANGKDSAVLGITEQLIGMPELGASGFRYCGSILPLEETMNLDIRPGLFQQVQKITQYLTKAHNLTGVNGVDFILDGNRVYITEINPRYSASMELMERAYGLPMFEIHLQAAKYGTLPEVKPGRHVPINKYYGKAVLFADRAGKAPETSHWRQRGICDIPKPGEIFQAGDPICTLMTIQPDRDRVVQNLLAQAESLRKEIFGKTCES